MSAGREFQVCGAETENARRASSVHTLGTVSSGASDDHRSRQSFKEVARARNYYIQLGSDSGVQYHRIQARLLQCSTLWCTRCKIRRSTASAEQSIMMSLVFICWTVA